MTLSSLVARTFSGDDRKAVPVAAFLLNALATLQVVWVYLLHTPSALNLTVFENGAERTPFQYRLLMALPLRWAHRSPTATAAAATLARMHGWLPAHISPEGLIQALIDLLCLAITGLVARQLFQASARTRILTPFIYPLTLVLVVSTYAFATTHALRFVYDLPSLALFAIGLYTIYFRLHPGWFIVLFLVATVNRETSLLLLPLYAVTQCVPRNSERSTRTQEPFSASQAIFDRTNLYALRTPTVLLPLAIFWISWHLWLVHRFAANPTAAGPRLLLNLGILLCPLSWPQVASACGFLCPIVFLYRHRIHNPILRLWVWLLPVWFGFMLFFGLLIEPRVFGELIPLVACAAASIAEESILRHTGANATTPTLPNGSRVLPFPQRRSS